MLLLSQQQLMFFFFESQKERRIREDIEKNMQICLQNPKEDSKKYDAGLAVLTMHVSSSDQRGIQQLVDTIKATIKNDDLQPVRKYQAIRLLKDLMKTHNKALGKYVVKKTLKRLTILAQHKTGTKEDGDQERGRDIFGQVKRDQQKYSIKFLNTLLMALQQWGTKWPKSPDGPYKDFHRQYNDLVINRVKFPKEKPKEPVIQPVGGKGASRSLSPIDRGRGPSQTKLAPKKATSDIEIQKPTRQRSSTLKPSLEKEFSDFFDKISESLTLFCEFLESASLEDFPILREIVAEMQKACEKGNELIIQLDQGLENSSQAKKIQSIFTFMETLKRQLNVVSKKPEKFDIFQRKYIKSSKSTLKLINQKDSSSAIRERKQSTNEREKPSTSDIRTESVVPREQQKSDVPKIKSQNRYASVTTAQVLQQFGQSKKIDQNDKSVGSERFGSFGAPNSERHRAGSITAGSPTADQRRRAGADNNNSDKRHDSPTIPKYQQRDSVHNSQEGKEKMPAVIQPRQSLKPERDAVIEDKQANISEFKVIKVRQTEQMPPPEKNQISVNKSADFFKDFDVPADNIPAVQEKQPDNPFKNNDSFGAFGSQKAVSNKDQSMQEDFFAKLENNDKAVNNISNVQPRRRQPARSREEKNVFEPKQTSQLSDGMSAFDFKNGGDNSQISGNRSDNKNIPQIESKRSIHDNPFATGLEPRRSQASERNVSSKFFDEFDRKSGKQQIASSNVIPKEGVIEIDNNSVSRENPFGTGNFGNLAQESRPVPQDNINPFETSYGSKKINNMNQSNPFQTQNNPFQTTINDNPFQTTNDNPLQVTNPFNDKSASYESKSKQSDASKRSSKIKNPFEISQQNIENPFQTSTHKSGKSQQAGLGEFLEIFKPPTQKSIQSNNQGGFHKKIQPKESIVFPFEVDKGSQHGINFSQLMDPSLDNSKKPSRQNNPFSNSFQNKSQPSQKSGFSLSNFAPVGGEPIKSGLNKTQDFFANFEKSQKSNSQRLKQSVGQNSKDSKDFFGEFNAAQPQALTRKSQNERKGVIQNTKTVRTNSEKSFNFQQLQNESGGLKKGTKKDQGQQLGFSDFGDFGNTPKKQELGFENSSQKSLSWGDFDKEGKQQLFQPNSNTDRVIEGLSNNSQMLEVNSRGNLSGAKTDRSIPGAKASQNSIILNIEDFTPLAKKGVEWNPLSLIPNLKPPAFRYIVDEEKLKEKKQILQQRKQNYQETVNQFRQTKEKNNQIRAKLLEKVSKIEDIISEKTQFYQLLKKVKEANDIKEKQIAQLNLRVKTAEEIKAKILQKEKLLYQITKNQIKAEDRKTPLHRNMASKWQLFNKNLQKNRNSVMVNSRYTQAI